MLIPSQWIGLRENLQETIDFTIKYTYGFSCKLSLKPMHFNPRDFPGFYQTNAWTQGQAEGFLPQQARQQSAVLVTGFFGNS